MKRPQGFDRVGGTPAGGGRAAKPAAKRTPKPPAPPAAKPAAARSAAARSAAPAPASAADRAATTSRPTPSRRTPSRRPVGRPSAKAAARAEVRAAARERRRVEKGEVRRFTRRARRRRIGWLVTAGVFAVLIGLVATAVYSPILALREIRVDGTSRVDAGEIRAAVDGQLGVPLALLDEEAITEALGEFPLIRSYTTELVPPSTLILHIAERTPIGVVRGDSAFDLVDPAGVVVDTSATRPDGMPLIELSSGRTDDAAFRSMAEVLLALPPAILDRVDTVSALTRDDVTLTLTGLEQRVTWGSAERSGYKARVLEALVAQNKDRGPGEYDVSAPGVAVFHED